MLQRQVSVLRETAQVMDLPPPSLPPGANGSSVGWLGSRNTTPHRTGLHVCFIDLDRLDLGRRGWRDVDWR